MFPKHVSRHRAIFIIILDTANVGFIVFGAIKTPEVSTYFLMIFIGNLIVYLFYYFLMKLVKKEKILPIAYVLSALSIGEISHALRSKCTSFQEVNPLLFLVCNSAVIFWVY